MLAAAGAQETREERAARAGQAMLEERFADAEKLYAELAKEDPANLGVHLSLGISRQSLGKFAEAIAPLRAVTGKEPSASPAWLLLGMCYRGLKRHGEAIPAFERVLELEPENRTALSELAEAFREAGKLEAAAQRFLKLAQVEPSSPRAWQGLGECYLHLGRAEEARVESLAPGSAWWWVLRARRRAAEGRLAAAAALYNEALALDPKLAGVRAARADIYLEMGKADLAAQDEKAEAALPEPDCDRFPLPCDYRTGQFWQLIEHAQGKPSAVNAYWRALAYARLAEVAFSRLDELPLSAEVLERRADSLMLFGRYAPAAQLWREAIHLDPADARYYAELARCLLRAGEFPEAEGAALGLLQREPGNAEWQSALGAALLEQGRAAEAVAHLEKGTGPSLDLARAYHAVRQNVRAIEVLQRLAPADTDGTVCGLLAGLLKEAGKVEAAAGAAGEAARLERTPAGRAAAIERHAGRQ